MTRQVAATKRWKAKMAARRPKAPQDLATFGGSNHDHL
jgi:hypothetical protein